MRHVREGKGGIPLPPPVFRKGERGETEKGAGPPSMSGLGAGRRAKNKSKVVLFPRFSVFLPGPTALCQRRFPPRPNFCGGGGREVKLSSPLENREKKLGEAADCFVRTFLCRLKRPSIWRVPDLDKSDFGN